MPTGWAARGQTAITGVAGTELYRNREIALTGLCVQAGLDAIADAGLEPSDIDAVVGIPTAPNSSGLHAEGYDQITSYGVAEAVGIERFLPIDVAIDMLVVGAVGAASQAIAAGLCSHVLVVRALFHPPDVSYAGRPGLQAAGTGQFMEPYGIGATGPVKHALFLSRFLYERDLGRSDLYPVIRLAREQARDNPVAYWRDAAVPTLEEYLQRPTPFEPLSILDCDLPVSGATAFVVSSAAAATERTPAAYISGFMPNRRADEIFEQAQVDRHDVDVLELYDGFSYFVPQHLERLGFCEFGRSTAMIERGRAEDAGSPALNTFGGSLGEGRLHGGGHVREAVLQVMGRAGDRQVPGARHCVVNNGLVDHGWTMLLSSASGR